MKIIQYEARNMIVLGDVLIDDLDRDVLQIVGLNGSGKSLLLSTFHPYSTSGRITKSYPIEIGKTGYKKIVFKDGNILWITEHEYTPKGDSHSCKSYLTKIENGMKEELNPTGHNILYKELVEKHLNYHSRTEEISSLSESMNGITNSTPLDRKRTIESTIDAERIGELKKNVTNALRDRRGAAKGMQQHKIQLLSNKAEDSERLYLENIKDSIYEIESIEIPRLEHEKIEITEFINELNTGNEINVEFLKEIVEVLTIIKDKNFNNLLEAKEYYQQIDQKVKYTQLLLNNYNEKLLEMQHWRQIADDMEEYKNRLKEANSNKEVFINNLKKLTKFNIEEVINNVTDITTTISNLDLWNSFFNDNAITGSDIHNIIREQSYFIGEVKTKIEEYSQKINRFNSIDVKNVFKEEVPKENNCDRCFLYSKFIKDVQWKEENINNIKIWQDEHNRLMSIFMFLNTHSIEDLSRNHNKLLKFFTDDILLNRNVYNLEDGFMTRSFNGENFRDILSSIKDIIFEYRNLNDEINELEIKISKMSHNYNKELDKEYNNKVKEIKEEFNNLYNDKSVYEGYRNIIDSNTKYNVFKLEELKSIIDSNETSNSELKRHRDRLVYINDTIDSFNRDLKRLIAEKSRVQEVLRQIDTTNKALIKYTKESEELEVLKEILEKDIPFHLLQENLMFIENEVNTILDGIFPYSIEIKVEEDNIVIPVLRHRTNQITPDIRNCSSGEKTVVGLLLNAAVLHILGYSILCLDEVDAQLDEVYRSKYDQIIHIIMNRFNIEQVFCISHNLGSHISNSMTLTLGDVSDLTIVGESKSVYNKA